MRSKQFQSRAARPIPPYTTSSAGFSATSGSRLFISMRSGASVIQVRALKVLPRAARMSLGFRGASMLILQGDSARYCGTKDSTGVPRQR